MIVFVENSKEPTRSKKNLLEQTSKFSKTAVYKISTQNSTVVLYTQQLIHGHKNFKAQNILWPFQKIIKCVNKCTGFVCWCWWRNERSKQMERHHIYGMEDSTKDVNSLKTDTQV